MTDPITFSGDYLVGAGQNLSFDATPAFQMGADHAAARLAVAGHVTLAADLPGGDIVGVESEVFAGQATVWVKAGGIFSVQGAGDQSVAILAHLYGDTNLVRNDGSVQVIDGDWQAVGVEGGQGRLTFLNTGSFVVTGRFAVGIANQVDTFHFTNSGLYEVIADERAIGLDGQAEGHVDNSGTVVVVSYTGAADGIRALASGSDVINAGHITATGALDSVAVHTGLSLSFVNTGSILADCTGAGVATAVITSGWDDKAEAIVNQGVIRGDIAIRSFGEDGLSLEALDNSGRIFGAIQLNGGDDSVVNTGAIIGDLDLGDGSDSYDGSEGRLSGMLTGGLGADSLAGGRGGDVIYGDAVAASGADGADVLSGGRGGDALHGGGGDDTLTGGSAADTLDGGAGQDTFAFLRLSDSKVGAGDVIVSLGVSDRIDLSRIDADVTVGGNQAFHQVSALDGHAGEVALVYDAGSDATSLLLDVDGDGAADMQVTIGGDASGFTDLVL